MLIHCRLSKYVVSLIAVFANFVAISTDVGAKNLSENGPLTVLIRHGQVEHVPPFPITHAAGDAIREAVKTRWPLCTPTTIHYLQSPDSSPRFLQTANAVKVGMLERGCTGKTTTSLYTALQDPRKPTPAELDQLAKMINDLALKDGNVWVLSGQVLNGLSSRLKNFDHAKSWLSPSDNCNLYLNFWSRALLKTDGTSSDQWMSNKFSVLYNCDTDKDCPKCAKPAFKACKNDSDCPNNGACARPTAAPNAPLRCCASGKSALYDGYYYCLGMPVGSTCWSDAQCDSQLCKGNSGGFERGTCFAPRPVGGACEDNNQCKADACARPTAADNAPLKCCASGKSLMYAFYDYCSNMPENSVCWSDAECDSGYCRDNWSGLQKGKCFNRRKAGSSCEYDGDCLNGACARPTAADNAPLQCCPSGKSGMYGGYYYCLGMPDGSTCWSDAECKSGTCKGNWYGLQRGTCTK